MKKISFNGNSLMVVDTEMEVRYKIGALVQQEDKVIVLLNVTVKDGCNLKIIGKEIKLPYKIGDVVSVEDRIIVRLSIPSEESYNRNFWRFDKDGNKLWRIESAEHKKDNNSYINMRIKDGKL